MRIIRLLARVCWLGLIFASGVPHAGAAEARGGGWDRAIVHLDVTRKDYDYTQPWSRRMKASQKTGIVLPDREILTTADQMFDRTLVRLQKGGRGKWWPGEVKWIDYHANLAVVTATEPEFWTDLKPAELAESKTELDALQILRWREGKLEIRRAEFNQFTVDTGKLSFAPQLQLHVTSEIQGAGAGEPVISDSRVIAMIADQSGNKCVAIPTGFIVPILQARKSGTYRGLGYFDFYWQPAVNPASLAFLQLEGEPRGVIVIDVPAPLGDATPALKRHDVLLRVDGFEIDIQGDYTDPDYGPLSVEYLATRRKWAGQPVNMQIWRDGKVQEIEYRLPKADYSATLVPDAVYDQEPEYLIAGGLVFQPLTDEFLKTWGADWKRRSPFRLYYYNNQHPTQERPALVFLSQVLPDLYNLGYQDLRYLVLDEVNGRKISYLSELQEALKSPIDGFHRIRFVQSDSLQRLVLSAEDLPQATRRVLETYGIVKESFIVEPPKVAASEK